MLAKRASTAGCCCARDAAVQLSCSQVRTDNCTSLYRIEETWLTSHTNVQVGHASRWTMKLYDYEIGFFSKQ